MFLLFMPAALGLDEAETHRHGAEKIATTLLKILLFLSASELRCTR